MSRFGISFEVSQSLALFVDRHNRLGRHMNSEENLSVRDVSSLYGLTLGAIRTALWRHRRDGVDPGFALPTKVRGRYRWSRQAVEAHLKQLRDAHTDEAKPQVGQT